MDPNNIAVMNNLATTYKNLGKFELSEDLFCKIITGDKSDNICGVFKKCGKVTALKLWNDKNSLEKKLDKENSREIFERNKKIIDFRGIPTKLSDEFLKEFIKIF